MLESIYIQLGTNQGDREKNLAVAKGLIQDQIGKIIAESKCYETEPMGMIADDFFYNAVIELETALSPTQLMLALLDIEHQMGRVRTESQGYSSRIIDLDILYYGQQIIASESLEVPHPRVSERRFCLEPMCDINPSFLHPISKESQQNLLNRCKDQVVSQCP